MAGNETKVYTFDSDKPDSPKERVITETKPQAPSTPMLFQINGRRTESLKEAVRALQEASADTSVFPALLRDGLKAILFDSYNEVPSTFQDWCAIEASNKQNEDYIRGAMLGQLPRVPEGDPVPRVSVDLAETIKITNYKYEAIFDVTEEMIKFDRTGIIRQYPADMGAAARMTQEAQAFAVINTAGNFTMNSTTSDNDVGANTAATVFSGQGLNTAYAVISTAKDRRSGRYLGLRPDTLIVAPRLELPAKMLLFAPEIVRQHGSTTVELFGTGQANPFRGLIRNLIVSPYMGTSYQWCLLQAKKAVVFQEVEPLTMWVEDVKGHQDNWGWFNYDVIGYKVRVWFGAGLREQKAAYLSTATTWAAIG